MRDGAEHEGNGQQRVEWVFYGALKTLIEQDNIKEFKKYIRSNKKLIPMPEGLKSTWENFYRCGGAADWVVLTHGRSCLFPCVAWLVPHANYAK